MLLLIAVLAVLSAAFLLFGMSRRKGRELSTGVPETTQLRPLFEPTREEVAATRREAEAREIARREVAARAKDRERIDAALADWRSTRSTSAAGRLLTVITESGDAQDFSRASGEIIDHFGETGFTDVSANTVAELIESHRVLLPVSERSSGTLLWIKEEVAKLRSFTSGNAAQKTS